MQYKLHVSFPKIQCYTYIPQTCIFCFPAELSDGPMHELTVVTVNLHQERCTAEVRAWSKAKMVVQIYSQ